VTISSPPVILLIDDEASIRLPLRLVLERYGYRVLEATNGEEGLSIMKERGDEIAVVVVDHHMPLVSGGEVLGELRRRRSAVPVILMSGVSLQDTGVGPAEPSAFLRKPFELAELGVAVRRLVSC
jgi:DNA-binding response OmpR family regulator